MGSKSSCHNHLSCNGVFQKRMPYTCLLMITSPRFVEGEQTPYHHSTLKMSPRKSITQITTFKKIHSKPQSFIRKFICTFPAILILVHVVETVPGYCLKCLPIMQRSPFSSIHTLIQQLQGDIAYQLYYECEKY